MKKTKNKKKRFKYVWVNQTNLGREFNMSSIAIGKYLIKEKLKESGTGFATDKAVNEGYATLTPLKDGTKFYMWNKERVSGLLKQEHQPATEVEKCYADVIKTLKEIRLDDEGRDKEAYMYFDCFWDEIPKDIRPQLKEMLKNSEFKEMFNE